MNTPLQWILRLGLIPCLLLATSCVDVREEFWVHKDGSAEAEIICDMPRAAALATGGTKGVQALAEKLMEDEACVDSYEVQVSERGKRLILRIQCKVDDLMSFEQLEKSIASHEALPPAVRKMVGEFDIGLAGLTQVSVTRTVNAGEAVPALLWLPKSQIKDHSLVKIIHFPHPVHEHNAHEQWDDGHTLSWETPLATAIQGPVVYQFTMPLPIPWLWIAAGLAILALLLVALQRWRKRRNARRANPVKPASS